MVLNDLMTYMQLYLTILDESLLAINKA